MADDFKKALEGTKNYGILNRGLEKYGKNPDGKQPYYWYQGIGRTKNTGIYVTHNGVNVVWDGGFVTHT